MEIEGHPIPQDITGFQFKLVGDMSVKQFAFLAGGLLLAWLFFSLPLPFLLKIPLVLTFIVAGCFFAFAPVRGRSADTMLVLFFKALFRPNQFVYKPSQPIPSTPSVVSDAKPPIPEDKPQDKNLAEQSTSLPIAQPSTPIPQSAPSEPAVPIVEHDLKQAQVAENQEPNSTQAQEAHAKVVELEKQMQDLLVQKQELEKHVVTLQQQLTTKQEPVFKPSDMPTQTPNVKTVPDQFKKAVGIPLAPDVPNVLTGIVKDPRGNILHNILIEVKDKDGNSVRAFKTNPLGQFASATPLVNGTYTITFEDPKQQQRFDTILLTADGSIIKPLEVISVDAREELRKSLFQSV